MTRIIKESVMNISIHSLIALYFRQASEYAEYESKYLCNPSYRNGVTQKFVRNVNIISAGQLLNQSENPTFAIPSQYFRLAVT